MPASPAVLAAHTSPTNADGTPPADAEILLTGTAEIVENADGSKVVRFTGTEGSEGWHGQIALAAESAQ